LVPVESKIVASKTGVGLIRENREILELRETLAKQVHSVYTRLSKEIFESRKAIMVSLWKAREGIKQRGSNAQRAIDGFYNHYAKEDRGARLEVVINGEKVKPL